MNDTTFVRAPKTIMLSGKEYQVRDLSDKQTLILDELLRADFLRSARMSGDNEVLELALQRVLHLTWMGPDGASLLSTPSALGHVLWLSAVDLDQEQAKIFAANVENSGEIYRNLVRPLFVEPGERAKSGEPATGEV